MNITIKTIKAEDNAFNSLLEDDNKIGDTVTATTEYEGVKFVGRGDTQDEAIEDLKERIESHYHALAYIAKVEIDKANGVVFFD